MWHRAVFNVPSDTPREKVIEKAPNLIDLFIRAREKEGWRLISRVWLDPFSKPVKDEPDRLEYTVWAQFERRPITRKIEVPANPKLLETLEKKYGAKLSD